MSVSQRKANSDNRPVVQNRFLCGYVSPGFQSQPLTARGGMLHPIEPLFSHLESGPNLGLID